MNMKTQPNQTYGTQQRHSYEENLKPQVLILKI
jgi:hypothetical protein